MPRFVILEHDHPVLHWDLMLESGPALKTWRLSRPPSESPESAEAIGDHRLAYLDYEGPLSGNRGSVKRWDAGIYDLFEQTEEVWRVELQGERWRGEVALRRRGSAWDVVCSASSP